MRKIITIGLISIFLMTSFSVFGLTINNDRTIPIIVNYSFKLPLMEKVEIKDTSYDKIVIPETVSIGNPGLPCLPVKGAYILLPRHTSVFNIEVTYDKKICLGSDYVVKPGEKPVFISKKSSSPALVPNKAVYSSSEMYPGRLYDIVGTYRLRGYNILVLSLNPVQYIPSSGELFYYPDLSIHVKTVKDIDEKNICYRGLEKDKTIVKDKVDNPILVDYYPKKTLATYSKEQYDLMIITTSELKNGFQSLKDYHDNRGISTIIVTLDEIGSDCSSEDIRSYVRDAYNEMGVDYLLLGGDADVVPTRGLWVRGIDEGEEIYGGIPSDLYYGCLDGPFNYNNNDKWGEPTDGAGGKDVDLLAEVYVGRACVDDLTEVNNFVSKTIKYLESGFEDYIENYLLVGEFLGNYGKSSYGGNYMDQLVESCDLDGYYTKGISPRDFEIKKLYDRDCGTVQWANSDVIEHIMNGVHIINHDGHSHYRYNMRLFNSDVERIHNTEVYFIYSQGCMAGGFDDPLGYDCIAEYHTVKTPYAAFAAIMNARYGIFYADSTDGDSQRYHREFWDAVFGEGKHVISQANQDSKEDNLYLISRTMMRWCYFELNLFGDPTISFYLSQPPLKPLTPQGPTSGKPGNTYHYFTRTTDPNGGYIQYLIDWGDGTDSGWSDPYYSGNHIYMTHIWKTGESFQVKSKARDKHNMESEWSDPQTVSISTKSKPIIKSRFGYLYTFFMNGNGRFFSFFDKFILFFNQNIMLAVKDSNAADMELVLGR